MNFSEIAVQVPEPKEASNVLCCKQKQQEHRLAENMSLKKMGVKNNEAS